MDSQLTPPQAPTGTQVATELWPYFLTDTQAYGVISASRDLQSRQWADYVHATTMIKYPIAPTTPDEWTRRVRDAAGVIGMTDAISLGCVTSRTDVITDTEWTKTAEALSAPVTVHLRTAIGPQDQFLLQVGKPLPDQITEYDLGLHIEMISTRSALALVFDAPERLGSRHTTHSITANGSVYYDPTSALQIYTNRVRQAAREATLAYGGRIRFSVWADPRS